MNLNYKVKQVTRLYESCNKCGLPDINCICSVVPKVKTNAKLWLLSTEREFIRPSNTARILKLVNPESTDIILWERTNNPERLIESINSEIYETYLLFPVENENTVYKVFQYRASEKIPAFILLDGTWKEGNLCTIEAAIEILKINHDHEDAQLIEGVFKLFLQSFKSGLNGTKIME